MKKIVLFLVFLLCCPVSSYGRVHFLNLKTSNHPGFTRIVLEGHDMVISRAMVFQKDNSVLVNFPDINFTIQHVKNDLPFSMTDKNTVMFYPGEFTGLKVSTLKNPSSLIIDVYLKDARPDLGGGVMPMKIEKPAEDSAPVSIMTVVIDPGHGGYESGIVNDEYREKNIVFDIARKLRVLIDKGGAKGHLIRSSDRFVSQSERVSIANERTPDVFISLHIGKTDKTVLYVPVVTEHYEGIVKQHLANRGQAEYMKKTVTLLNAVKQAVGASFGEDMVVVKPLPYSILSEIGAAAIMIELPYFDDADYIEELKEEIANTLYKGLYIYEELSTG